MNEEYQQLVDAAVASLDQVPAAVDYIRDVNEVCLEYLDSGKLSGSQIASMMLGSALAFYAGSGSRDEAEALVKEALDAAYGEDSADAYAVIAQYMDDLQKRS